MKTTLIEIINHFEGNSLVQFVGDSVFFGKKGDYRLFKTTIVYFLKRTSDIILFTKGAKISVKSAGVFISIFDKEELADLIADCMTDVLKTPGLLTEVSQKIADIIDIAY